MSEQCPTPNHGHCRVSFHSVKDSSSAGAHTGASSDQDPDTGTGRRGRAGGTEGTGRTGTGDTENTGTGGTERTKIEVTERTKTGVTERTKIEVTERIWTAGGRGTAARSGS